MAISAKAARRVPMRPRNFGRKGPAIRMPIGPIATLRPMAQAGQPSRSISSGINCSVRPKAMSHAPTAAMAATMFPVREGAGAVLMAVR